MLVPEFRHSWKIDGAWDGHLRHSETALRSEILIPNVEFTEWRKMSLRTTTMSQGLSLL